MRFGKKEADKEDEYKEVNINTSEFTGFDDNHTKDAEQKHENEAIKEFKKRAFYWAINGKDMQFILNELEDFSKEHSDLKKKTIALKTKFIEEQLEKIQKQIKEEKEKLGRIEGMDSELVEEKEATETKITDLEKKIQDLVNKLGEAHSNLISNRLKAVKEELKQLVEMYNETFKSKLENEGELKKSIETQRTFCDTLIEKNTTTLNTTIELLNNGYKFGNSKYASLFLVSTGMLSAIASGWFFAIFAKENELYTENWLFYIITNLLEYLQMYVVQFGPFSAMKYTLGYFSALLIVISIVVWVSELLLYKLTNDRSNYEFSIESNQKKKGFFSIKINAGSFLSLWFQALPWIFIGGIIVIIISVGDAVSDGQQSVGKLGEQMLSQVIGTTIAFLCTALFFLYITKVIEPRKIAEEKRKDSEPTIEKERKKFYHLNKELLILILAANAFMVLIIFSQIQTDLMKNKLALLAIFLFVLLVNLTAFILSYGIRQTGLYKTLKTAEDKVFQLSDYREALSSNKPIGVWASENSQFNYTYIALQRELFDLIHAKNKALYQLDKKQRVRIYEETEDGKKSWFDFLIPKKNTHTRKQVSDFNHLNFPEISYQIDELKKKQWKTNEELKQTNKRITDLREGQSDFQRNINFEVKRLKKAFNLLLKRRVQTEADVANQHKQLHFQKLELERQLIEGHELGVWMKKTIIERETIEK